MAVNLLLLLSLFAVFYAMAWEYSSGSATNAFLNLANSAGLLARRLLLLNANQGAKHVDGEVLVTGAGLLWIGGSACPWSPRTRLARRAQEEPPI